MLHYMYIFEYLGNTNESCLSNFSIQYKSIFICYEMMSGEMKEPFELTVA